VLTQLPGARWRRNLRAEFGGCRRGWWWHGQVWWTV